MINPSLSRSRFFALALPLFAALGLSAATAATTITFDGQTAFDSAFPTDSRTVIGGGSSVSLITDPARVDLLASSTASTVSRVTLYSAASFSAELDFTSGPLSLTFTNITLNYPGSGSSYNGHFGLASADTGALGGSGNAIYFNVNRNDQTLSLVQSVGGVATTLATWTNAGDLNYAFDNITSLTLTLTDSSWSVSGTAVRKGNPGQTANITGSGSLNGVVWTASSWGADTYLALEANQTVTASGRYAEFKMGEINVVSAIPEPHTAALGAGAACLLLAGWLRRRRG